MANAVVIPIRRDMPTRMSALTSSGALDYAVRFAESLESLMPVPIARKTPGILHISQVRAQRMRKAKLPEEAALLTEYTDWQVAYSSSISENASRLRGAMWAHNELRKHPEDPRATQLAGDVYAILASRWGVHDVPTDKAECDQLARETALSMARADLRTPEEMEG